MGMFDYVNFKVECPKCGWPVEGFQSKDGKCELETVEPETVEEFYSTCKQCDQWIQYEVVKPVDLHFKQVIPPKEQ